VPSDCGSPGGDCGAWIAFTQLIGSPSREHFADHPETANRWAGRLQDVSGWNIWSWRTKFFA
jgi:hypothetical protein